MIFTFITADTCTGAGLIVCIRVCTDPRLRSPRRNEIPPVFLRDFIVFMVCIISTYPLPPPSEQLDKIHLMVCQEVGFFPPPPRLSCKVLSFSNNQVLSVYNDLPQSQRDRGGTGQQLPMSGNRRAATSAFIDWDGVLVAGSAPPSAGGSAVLSHTASSQPPRMCTDDM